MKASIHLMKSDINFFIKASILFGVLSATFSVIGIYSLPETTVQPGASQQPRFSISIEHIGGHIMWGLIAGAASLSLRYFLLGGSFGILLDADHLIYLMGTTAIPRMGHSIPFGIISAAIMMLVLGRKDYLLGAVSFATVLAHISFDLIFSNGAKFPIFILLNNNEIYFHKADWVFFMLGAVILIGSVMMKTRYHKVKKSKSTI